MDSRWNFLRTVLGNQGAIQQSPETEFMEGSFVPVDLELGNATFSADFGYVLDLFRDLHQG
jgi:hypothetical protein